VVLAMGAVAALAYLAVFPTAPLWVCALVKPLPVLSLAIWCGRGTGRARAWLTAGLVASAFGDLLLVFPRLFVPGMAVFLAAHLLYTAAFLACTRRLRVLRAVPFALWGAAGFALLAPLLGALVWPVAVYVLAICLMMWRAAACVGSAGRPTREEWWALAGAVAFGMSDTLLSLHRFLTPWPDAPYVYMILYWAGQTGLARSVRPATGVSDGFGYHHAGSPAA
jgi:alkenylglycerophosphocholine/alkenylglycerophosphoethanolamine hydrolase